LGSGFFYIYGGRGYRRPNQIRIPPKSETSQIAKVSDAEASWSPLQIYRRTICYFALPGQFSGAPSTKGIVLVFLGHRAVFFLVNNSIYATYF